MDDDYRKMAQWFRKHKLVFYSLRILLIVGIFALIIKLTN